MGAWAEEASVADDYGLTAEQLNDDRLGRALERIADQRDSIQAATTLAVVKHWKLKVKQVHYDISHVELVGADPAAKPTSTDPGEGPSPTTAPTVPFPTYGRTKSGRDDVQQVPFGLNVLGDGGLPVGLLPFAGNTAEARTHLANLLKLRELFPRHQFLYLGDSQLDTPENLAAAQCTAGQFLCAAAFTLALQQRFLAQRRNLKPVDDCSQADAKRPLADRDHYQGCEVSDEVTSTFAGKQVRLKHRLLFVQSSARENLTLARSASEGG